MYGTLSLFSLFNTKIHISPVCSREKNSLTCVTVNLRESLLYQESDIIIALRFFFLQNFLSDNQISYMPKFQFVTEPCNNLFRFFNC